MKKRNSGCCFLFVCLLFLLPGLFLVRNQLIDKLPDRQTVEEHVSDVREKIKDLVHHAGNPAETTEAEKKEFLQMGEAGNSCSYYYWQLDPARQVEYMKILKGLEAMEENIDLLLDEAAMKEVVKMVFADHPELFFADQSYDYLLYETRVQMHPRYTCSPEEKESRMAEVEATVQEAVQTIPADSGPYACMQALYSYVVNTVDYDLNSTDNQNIYSSMVNRVSVCTGYAKELQYLLQRVGIQALLAEGEIMERGPHAWLIANYNGNYYHLDPTFGDPSFEGESEEELSGLPPELQVDYSFFCCDDVSIFCDRILSDELPVSECTSRDLLYYPMKGRYFYSYDDTVLISLQESIDRGETFWEGQFADEQAYADMLDAMQEGTFANLILANDPYRESVQLRLSYRYESYVVKMWY